MPIIENCPRPITGMPLDTALGGKRERTPISGCKSVVGISL